MLGSELNLSSSYHPQIDGQIERFNAMLEKYLRHFVSANQKNWTEVLDVAQFCFNLKKSSSTNKSSFKIVTKEWKNNAEIAQAYLEKATKRMKKWANQ